MNRNQQYKLILRVIECNISTDDDSNQLTEGFVKL